MIIEGTTNSWAGIAAEHQWLGPRFPRVQFRRQTLTLCDRRTVDVVEFTTPDGATHAIYFDITAFHDFYDVDGQVTTPPQLTPTESTPQP